MMRGHTPVSQLFRKWSQGSGKSKVKDGQKLTILYLKHIPQEWWHMPVVSVTWEAKVGGSLSEVSYGKHARPYLKNKLKAKGLGTRLRWQSTA
jgi:hypothetical protein